MQLSKHVWRFMNELMGNFVRCLDDGMCIIISQQIKRLLLKEAFQTSKSLT